MENLEIVNKYDLIVWDFDGTIVNLHVNWEQLKQELHTILNLDKSKLLSLNELIYQGEKIISRDSIFNIIKKYELSANYSINNTALNMILYFYQNNITQCILSDNLYETIKTILLKIGLFDIFSIIISKEYVKKFKPNSEGLKKILSIINIEKNKVLFIGDSWKDTAIAKKENIDIIFINRII